MLPYFHTSGSYTFDGMNKDYIGCEIAARLTGHLENVILRHLTEGNYQEAKRHLAVLIDCYQEGGWGDHCRRWLADYQNQREQINHLINESAPAKRHP
jgi:uncharacterized protein YidB (DUF937 family)